MRDPRAADDATSRVPCAYDRDLRDEIVQTVAAFGRQCLATEACAGRLAATAAQIRLTTSETHGVGCGLLDCGLGL